MEYKCGSSGGRGSSYAEIVRNVQMGRGGLGLGSGKPMWKLGVSSIRFLEGATFDVLPSPHNFNCGEIGTHHVKMCSGNATFKHILSGYIISLSQGCYTW